MSINALAQHLLEIARGGEHWSSLTRLGVSVRRDINGWTFANASTAIVPSKQDIVAGLENLADDPGALAEWASFILCASPLISLERLGEDAGGEMILEALWDLSFDGVLSMPVRNLIEASRNSPTPDSKHATQDYE